MIKCEKCLNNANCQFLMAHKKAVVEDCTAFKNAEDFVDVEKYNELREAFVDFACSGINNVAPYCKNRRKECADEHGWCQLGIGDVCRGFNPDGEGREENE